MSLRRSRIPIAAVMSSSLLAGLAVAGSSGATTSGDTGVGNERLHDVGHGHRDKCRRDGGDVRRDERLSDTGGGRG